MKIADWNDSKLGTIVVLDSLSKRIDFGFKRSRVGLGLGLLSADQ